MWWLTLIPHNEKVLGSSSRGARGLLLWGLGGITDWLQGECEGSGSEWDYDELAPPLAQHSWERLLRPRVGQRGRPSGIWLDV